jgi:hypothetical protein
MTISIQLIWSPQKTPAQGIQATYEAVNASGMPNEIFVLKKTTLNPATGQTTVVFDHVATVADLASLPIGSPLAGSHLYRSTTFTQTFDTATDANNAIAALQDDVNLLIDSLNLAGEIGGSSTFTLTGT